MAYRRNFENRKPASKFYASTEWRISQISYKTANITIKNCTLIHSVLTETDQKQQKNYLKGDITQQHVDIQAMWW